ncbi:MULTISPECIES: endonuclease/exonuclease/phosphatase family protein [Capnocytophaga]|uniref:Rhythmic message 1 n=1 Tax=Capnocytophaga canis TaxID=1848903 RepID=A0A0B7IBH5_9FLAO|nr:MULTISPECIES: endonuclease/exonuclease/phosphatase family protein [Capnocytophaga]ATA72697.1 endonuclease [Capnocytophaga sp. H4358]ATA74797.1 endonuclease [Capnocytophaga sp. H2931]CEN45073.1 Rhythmic message 1 [Capnocytophaga canis]CEN48079.1 Rhythmic message 1 [Capnocytophaga canis]CEN53823.1 Rhythmic message 1 [Capnocytophaga canis]
MKHKYFILWILVFWQLSFYAQEKKYMVRTIAFYNVENLFDTINDPRTFDDDRTPQGADRWTSKVYNDHVQKIAKVIADIGSDVSKQAPDIVGLCEIENEDVIVDLINTDYLKKYNYGIVHYDSPDSRGVDVALIYKKGVFRPISTSKHVLKIFEPNGKRRYTRDQLLVSGMFDGEMMHFIVNHWPSRSGGEAASRPKREAAAALNKKIIDSLLAKDPKAKIFSMGDFNDDPTNASFKKILKTEGKKNKVKAGGLYNPMEEMLKKGIGSLAYQDAWNLFDQIYFTQELLEEDKSTYRYWKAGVFNKPYLANPKGKFKGYPFRSMSNGNYTWGYSDHFPVYLYLIKEMKL